MPQLKQLEINAKENAENWKSYVETEENKRIYLPNNGKPPKVEVKEEETKQDVVVEITVSDNGNSIPQRVSSDKTDSPIMPTI